MSKKIVAVALAVLMLLVVTVPASATIKATQVEIRGTVATAASSWNASNFAGFWYDLKDNLKTENLVMTENLGGSDSRTIPENSLFYNTSKAAKTLKVVENGIVSTDVNNAFTSPSTGKYEVVGWQALPYVAVKSKANKLAKLIIEQGNATAEKKTLTVGETWDIGDGWTVSAQSIDAKASPRQVWLVLNKDGVKLDDKVISQGQAYAYVEKSFAGESDVPLFVTYVDSVFAGATSDMVQLRYTWAISKSVTEVKVNDVFGNLEVVTADSDNIKLRNKDKTITLTRDATVDVMGEIKFRVADSATVRFYPKVDYEIVGEGGATPTATGTAVGTGTVRPTNATGTATAVGTATVVTTTEKPPAGTPEATATPKEPGFTTALAIVGLLAVAFLVLRQRK